MYIFYYKKQVCIYYINNKRLCLLTLNFLVITTMKNVANYEIMLLIAELGKSLIVLTYYKLTNSIEQYTGLNFVKLF